MTDTNVATLPHAVEKALPPLPGAIEGDAATALERVIALGDLSALTPNERNAFLMKMCHTLGLNPFTRPIEYIKLQGRLVCYAKRDCTDQLRKLHNVSLEITDRTQVGDVLMVTTRARLPNGRCDEDVGAVSVAGLRGEFLANATMKAITKSKRRVTLSVCGLGFLDETEVASVQSTETETAPASVAESARAQVAAPNRQTPLLQVIMPNERTVSFPKTRNGIGEALKFMRENTEAVLLNLATLDMISEKLPDMADQVADVRAAAAKALAPMTQAEIDQENIEDWPGASAGAEKPLPVEA